MKSKLIINLVILTVIVLFGAYQFHQSSAQTPVNVLGWAWGVTTDDNLAGKGATPYDEGVGLGWISGTTASQGTPASTLSYGLSFPQSDGLVFGNVWSSNVGWIDFQPGGLPPDGGTAGVQRIGNILKGWARIRSIADASPNNNGGWNGWIKFGGITQNNTPYDVQIKQFTAPIPPNYTHYLSGYAWSEDVGWIYFGDDTTINPNQPDNPPFIIIDFGAQPTPLTASCSGFPNPAQLSGGPPSVNVTWTASASGGSGNSANYTYSWSLTQGTPSNGSGQSIVTSYGPPPNSKRIATLTVTDITLPASNNTANAQCEVDILPPNTQPSVSCSGIANPPTGVPTTVTWTAVPLNANPPISYAWDFTANPDATPQTSGNNPVNVGYTTPTTKTATIKMTAGNGQTSNVCIVDLTGNKQPFWKEIIPFL
jgi:hypothetical protein